jgi:NADH dehydrogenase
MSDERVPRILIVGGGYVGMYTALRLQKKMRRTGVRITVVDPRSYMTYQPFLPEAAAGSLEPRHVVVPLRRVLKHCQVITGRVTKISHAERTATIEPRVGEPFDMHYDQVVIALGSIARTLPIPGLADFGIGFKQVEEAIALRNHVLDRLDVAASTADEKVRERALSFVVVGGGYAGVEALAELQDMAVDALRFYPYLTRDHMKWVLVEAANRILPEVGPEMGRYTVEELERHGIDVRMNTRLESCVDGHVVLSDGEEFDSDTLIWTAGVKANPVLAATDLPLDERGRLVCRPDLRVEGVDGAWGAGDCAAVPDLTSDEEGAMCSPSAQHAVRQAKHLADNIAAAYRGKEPRDYAHKHAGSVAGLGLHKGVAQVYGVKVKGLPAWFMHRTYHASRMPTFNRKVRVVLDWTLGLFFRREAVSMGHIHVPRKEFRAAASE